MKNITVSVDDDVYRRARVAAAEQDTSVSALVRQFLADIAAKETERERLKREEVALRNTIRSFRAADRLSRDDIHAR
jgi:plasmid stability protein